MGNFNGYNAGIGSIYLARRWRFDPEAGLFSLSNNYIWHGGVNIARCPASGGYRPHGALLSPAFINSHQRTQEHFERLPQKCGNPHCSCGFYAYYGSGREFDSYVNTGQFAGIIEGWGKCSIGDLGAQLEYAKVLALVPGEQFYSESKKPRSLMERVVGAPSRIERKETEHLQRMRERYPEAKFFGYLEDAIKEFPLGERTAIA